MLAKIIATDPAVPGEAQLLIRLRGIAELVEGLEFSLLNNQQNYLQEGGSGALHPTGLVSAAVIRYKAAVVFGWGLRSWIPYWPTPAPRRSTSSWLLVKSVIPRCKWRARRYFPPAPEEKWVNMVVAASFTHPWLMCPQCQNLLPSSSRLRLNCQPSVPNLRSN